MPPLLYTIALAACTPHQQSYTLQPHGGNAKLCKLMAQVRAFAVQEAAVRTRRRASIAKVSAHYFMSQYTLVQLRVPLLPSFMALTVRSRSSRHNERSHRLLYLA